MSISSKSDRWDTNSVRWKAPYDYSFAYRLFKIHYTEINNAYWASVPAYNTIKKEVLTYRVNNPIKNPLDFFIVRDEDDRRIAQTFDEWKNHHELFGKFNRLNMMFLATSCMEVYLRSIVSLALESKPSVLFYGHILVDGVLPMIRDNRYSCYADKKYPFYHIVDNICSGRWIDRYNTYEKYFGANIFLCNELDRLDEYRKKRNEYAHYYGRSSKEYENPILLQSKELNSISHSNLISYLDLIHNVIKHIDKHLYHKFIGGYELIKYIYQNNIFKKLRGTDRDKAKKLADIMGKNNLMPLGRDYFDHLIKYMNGICQEASSHNLYPSG